MSKVTNTLAAGASISALLDGESMVASIHPMENHLTPPPEDSKLFDWLNRLIEYQEQECSSLDYKSGKGFNDQQNLESEVRDITSDTSGLANANGGTLIYGIEEIKGKGGARSTVQFHPITNPKVSREWIENTISKVKPPLQGIQVRAVDLAQQSTMEGFCFVVEVPKSTTAHQAWDKKYYRRRTLKTEPMEHYEIQEVMNRQTWPDLTVDVRMGPCEPTPFDFGLNGKADHMLLISVTNSGTSLCNYFCVELVMPAMIQGQVVFSDYKVGLDTERGLGTLIIYDSFREGPTPPAMTRRLNVPFRLHRVNKMETEDGRPPLHDLLRLHVYADAKPREEAWLRVQDIWKAAPVLQQVL